jgi:hypothetical protein
MASLRSQRHLTDRPVRLAAQQISANSGYVPLRVP